MKKVLLMFMIVFSVISCKLLQNGNGVRMTAVSTFVTNNQIDSVCIADTIPSMEYWKCTSFKDYETGGYVCKCMYIKDIDSIRNVVYVVSGCEEPYKLTKRVTK